MHYQPSLPEKNNNITHTHPLKEFTTLLAGMLGLLLLTYLLLGFLVNFAVSRISPELETELFNHVPMHLLTTGVSTTDPRLAKLQQLTNGLKECAGIEIPITVHINDSDTINGLAIPGGHIIIFTGLLDLIDTENGLSFILAHELGHFKNRDHLRGLGRNLVLMTMASAITGPHSSLTKLVTPTIQLSQAKYSQNRETLADEVGLHTLNCYYGHVGGATDFFETMAKTEKSNSFSPYFGTHPEMKERIRNLNNQASKKNYQTLDTLSY